MINLLPDAKKAELRSARANTILVRYIFVLIGALLFIGSVTYVSYNSLKLSEQSAQSQLESGSESGSSANSPVSDAEVSTVIQSTTSASRALNAIASALPSGVVMKSLSIQPQQLMEATNMTLYAKANTQPTELVQQLDMTGVFSGTTVKSSQTNSKDVKGYPVKIDLSTRININQQARPLQRMTP